MSHKPVGFTLVELLLVIVILGIIGVGVTGLIGSSTRIFIDAAERQQLIGSGRFAVQRLTLELRNALPNSVRVAADPASPSAQHCLEFVPIVFSSTYTDIPTDSADTRMQVIEPIDASGSPYPFAGSEQVVVYPVSSADVYASPGKRMALDPANPCDDDDGNCATQEAFPNNLATLNFAVPQQINERSPASRYYLVEQPVSYCINGGELRRYSNYPYSQSQPFPRDVGLVPGAVIDASSGVLMAEGIGNSLSIDPGNPSVNGADPFRVVEPSLSRNAMVLVLLIMTRDAEQLTFNSEVNIANVP